MKFIEAPNLPSGNVDKLIIGQKYAGLLEKTLINHGISPIFIPNNPNVDDRMSGHADMSMLHVGGRKVVLADYLKDTGFAHEMMEAGFDVIVSNTRQGLKYPRDCGLNVCMAGKYVIYNPDTVYDDIDNFLTIDGLIKIPSRQGYSRCSVCVVDGQSIITADEGVGKAAAGAGMDVLMVKTNLVSLDGYNCGFIGGATFKLSKCKLAFTGIISDEKEKQRIENFIAERNVIPKYLTEEKLFDIGSAIPLTEKQ